MIFKNLPMQCLEKVDNSLEMPSITICSVKGYRNGSIDAETMEEFRNATFGVDDFFHSNSLEERSITFIKEIYDQNYTIKVRLGSLAGSVIQATGRSEFEEFGKFTFL
jgi:hypothetical protein